MNSLSDFSDIFRTCFIQMLTSITKNNYFYSACLKVCVAGIFITRFKRKEVEKGVERLVEGLVENQKKILQFITENSRIPKREMAEKLGISTTAVDKNINTLKKRGLLKRVGGAKGGYWKVTT